MIITRENKGQAYLTFMANGEIRLNKKTIGIWKVRNRRRFTENYTFFRQEKILSATVFPRTNREKFFQNGNKYSLMQMVATAIPDNMLPEA